MIVSLNNVLRSSFQFFYSFFCEVLAFNEHEEALCYKDENFANEAIPTTQMRLKENAVGLHFSKILVFSVFKDL
jgi:hypothetical protein